MRRPVLRTATCSALALSACTAPISWEPLDPSAPSSTKYAGYVDRSELQPRWARAVEVLEVSQDVASKAYIYVRSDLVWTDAYGRKVSGLLQGRWIIVGNDMAALAHELAHLNDMELGDGRTWMEPEEEAHARWLQDGTRARLDAYDSIKWGTQE